MCRQIVYEKFEILIVLDTEICGYFCKNVEIDYVEGNHLRKNKRNNISNSFVKTADENNTTVRKTFYLLLKCRNFSDV